MGVSATLKGLYKGEKKYLKFKVKDINGDAVDCTGSTVTCSAWESGAESVMFTVADASFDKTDIATGIFRAEATLSSAGTFILLFQITFSNGHIEKEEFEMIVTDRTPPS